MKSIGKASKIVGLFTENRLLSLAVRYTESKIKSTVMLDERHDCMSQMKRNE
jgi:hypothetical protein